MTPTRSTSRATARRSPRSARSPRSFGRKVVAASAVALFSLGAVACSDDDGNDDDLDNPLDGVDDQIDDGAEDVEENIESETDGEG